MTRPSPGPGPGPERPGGVLPGPLVGTDWLASRLGAPNLVVIDASWYLPQQHRDPRAEFRAAHIPGARFFDLDAASDPDTDLPHMLPSPAHFAEVMASLGVEGWHDVVAYDGSGVQMSAPRLWWMLRAFGHDRVAVLDGGLGKWLAEGRPVEAGEGSAPPRGHLTPVRHPALVKERSDVAAVLTDGSAQVVDARVAPRFHGDVDEPRAGLRRGHIPGARNLPFSDLVDPESGTYLPPHVLRARIASAGVDLRRPVIASCGSGVTACSLALALQLAGAGEVPVYDGSWSEWGRVEHPGGDPGGCG